MAIHLIAGVELGGTTCLAATAELRNPTEMIETFETDTTTPEETLSRLSKFLKKNLAYLNAESFSSIGIASFGPIDLRKDSPTYGHITTTPKKAWRNAADVVGFFKHEFGHTTPIAFETDTNAPALAEMAKIVSETNTPHKPTVAYITVGTGVGLGAVVDGAPIHGFLHPEGGHMMVPVMPGDDYTGGCEFHQGPCVEGMVHSKAIAERTGVSQAELHTIPDDHDIWEKVGYYLGIMCLNVTYVLSPHVIVLGGGIMKRKILYDIVRRWFKDMLKGYLDVDKFKTKEGLENYIRESTFGNSSGIIGALELARAEACKK